MPKEPDPTETTLFREHQRFLWGLSYRMTGSAADADDVVQETFVRAMQLPPARTDEPWRPWLTKVALNLSRDVLRRRKREGYTGPWLPGPAPTERFEDEEPPPSARYDRLESVTFAFLLALEALTAQARAVLLLRDVFDYSVEEAAQLLGMSQANVKTTHHRARRLLQGYDATRETKGPPEMAAMALQMFLGALAMRDGAALESLLAKEARSIGDGGGEFLAQRRVVVGSDRVTRLFLGITRGYTPVRAELISVNGMLGVLVETTPKSPRIAPRTLLLCDIDASGQIVEMYSVLTTAKLMALVNVAR